jgi:hypothetical protein
VLYQTEYIENSIRRCAQMEPDEFKDILNKLIDEKRASLITKRGHDSLYSVGTWNWYMELINAPSAQRLLEFAGLTWTPIPERTLREIAKQREDLGDEESEGTITDITDQV